jgi:AAA+ ATPase superfamily predicted ATPase
MFVDREAELAFLTSALQRTWPTPAQMVLLFGRRRVGKTRLLRRWAEGTGLPVTYWAAEREPAALQRRKLFSAVLGVELGRNASFDSWDACWEAIAAFLGQRRQILLLDELPYAAEADPAMLSSLQHAWDRLFQPSQAVMVICGSHVHTMETLLSQGSPLFGRFTGQWHLQPLAFSALSSFYPTWSAEERVAAYAVVGGIPAYLEWLDPSRSLSANLREVVLAPGSMFLAEPAFLVLDEVREPRVHLSILQAIGSGAHTLDDIANATLVGKAHLSSYLARLQELRLVERRLPATISPARSVTARMGRYHLSDAYLRFYFRFVGPRQDDLAYRPEGVLTKIMDGLRGFVGETAFEELAREWVIAQGRLGLLPFTPRAVGSHWGAGVQVDVVGVNWPAKSILLGECKWGSEAVRADVLRDLIDDKTPRLLTTLPDGGSGWRVHHALFARAGFTEATAQAAAQARVRLVDLSEIDAGLADRPDKPAQP